MYMLKQAIRSQIAKKHLAFMNIAGLSVCIAASLLMLLYVWSESNFDSFHDGSRIYRAESRLYENDVLTDNWATTTYGHGPALYSNVTGIDKYVRTTAQDKEQTVKYGDRIFTEEHYCYTEPSFFEIFNFPVIKGNGQTQLERPNTVVLSQSAASRYFGEEDPVGKTLTFSSSSSAQDFEITGIMEDMPARSHLHYDFLLSYSTIPKDRQDIWYIHGVYTYIRLTPGKNPHEVENDFISISERYKTDALRHKKWAIELIPLKDIHLNSPKAYEKEAKGSRTAIRILMIMSIAILLAGWANSLNFMTVRFLERGREFGLKKSFGASGLQIVTQGMLESLTINFSASMLALCLLKLVLPLASRYTGYDFGKGILSSSGFLAAMAATTAAGTIFIGLYPSLRAANIQPSQIMRGKPMHGRQGNMTRKVLISIQFIISFIFISGTVTIAMQVQYMQNETSKMADDRILVVKYPSFTKDLAMHTESFVQELRQQGNIENVTISGSIPGVEVANWFTNQPYGSDMSQRRLIQMLPVDCRYMDTYSFNLLCGRKFSESRANEANKVILNEEAIKTLGYNSCESALGQLIKMEVLDTPIEIIGVTGNWHQQSLESSYKPIIFFMKEQIPFIQTPYISILYRNEVSRQDIETAKEIYNSHFSDSLFSYFSFKDFCMQFYQADRNFTYMFTWSSILAVFVACIGLWVMNLVFTMSRMKETCIRKVFGADRMSLFMTMTREQRRLLLISSAIGVPVSNIIMGFWLETYAFHIRQSYLAYIIAFILLSAVVFMTTLRQTLRAIHTRPIDILKYE